MLHLISSKAVFSVLILALFAAPLTAQEKVVTQKPLEKIIDIDFPGGKIPDYLIAIEKQNGVKPNVVVSKVAAELILPPIRLKTVSVMDAVMAIEYLQMIDNYRIRIHGQLPNVMTIIADSQNRSSDFKKVHVFSVRSLLDEGYVIEDIVTAIETTWAMGTGSDTGAMLKYHEETSLLIAVGSRDDIGNVENVLAALASPKSKEAKLEKAIKRLDGLVAQLRKENEELKRKLEAK